MTNHFTNVLNEFSKVWTFTKCNIAMFAVKLYVLVNIFFAKKVCKLSGDISCLIRENFLLLTQNKFMTYTKDL